MLGATPLIKQNKNNNKALENMNDNTNTDTKTDKVNSLLAEVADGIRHSGTVINNRLRDEMVEREVASRVATLDKAFARRRELSNEFNKMNRADNETFNADGTPAVATYTKARLADIKKAREVLAKLENAMEAALTENNFQKLKELIK